MRNPTYIIPAEGALTVFTDGACLPSPRRGGIGIRFVRSDQMGNETIWDLEEPGYAGANEAQSGHRRTWGTSKRARLPGSVTRPDFTRLTRPPWVARPTCSPLSCGVQVNGMDENLAILKTILERDRDGVAKGWGLLEERRQWLKTPRALRSAHR